MLKLKLIAFNMKEATEEDKIDPSLGKEDLVKALRRAGIPTHPVIIKRLSEQEFKELVAETIERQKIRVKSDGLIFTPEQVLAMNALEEMPPIGTLIQLPGGEVEIGNTFDSEGSSDEKPVHRVKLSPFLISPYSVTNGEFRKFMEANGYSTEQLWNEAGWSWRKEKGIVQPAYWENPRFNQPNQPVVGVSWYEAAAYLKWAGKRLPTEHEREYAARGGRSGKRYPWGDEDPTGPSTPSIFLGTSSLGASRAHFGQPDDSSAAVEVNARGFAPNRFGMYHPAGNVWEWAEDWYGGKYYQTLAAIGMVENPKGPESGNTRILRGGSWDGTAGSLRVAYRNHFDPVLRDFSFGFRAARTL